jgi:hypothetical protein
MYIHNEFTHILSGIFIHPPSEFSFNRIMRGCEVKILVLELASKYNHSSYIQIDRVLGENITW